MPERKCTDYEKHGTDACFNGGKSECADRKYILIDTDCAYQKGLEDGKREAVKELLMPYGAETIEELIENVKNKALTDLTTSKPATTTEYRYKYLYHKGDIITSSRIPLNEFSGFARVLEVDRERNVLRMDLYTKYGEVHYEKRAAIELDLSLFEEEEYYRPTTLAENRMFADGLAKCVHGHNALTEETLHYVRKAIAARTELTEPSAP